MMRYWFLLLLYLLLLVESEVGLVGEVEGEILLSGLKRRKDGLMRYILLLMLPSKEELDPRKNPRWWVSFKLSNEIFSFEFLYWSSIHQINVCPSMKVWSHTRIGLVLSSICLLNYIWQQVFCHMQFGYRLLYAGRDLFRQRWNVKLWRRVYI